MKAIICDRCKVPKGRGERYWAKMQTSFWLYRLRRSPKFDLCNRCAQNVTLFCRGQFVDSDE
jgi:hypothetical protein